jgi:hypothetical protein
LREVLVPMWCIKIFIIFARRSSSKSSNKNNTLFNKKKKGKNCFNCVKLEHYASDCEERK